MMTKSKTLPLQSLYPLKWDLSLPDGFEKVLVPKYLDCFRIIKASNGIGCLKVIQWPKEYAVSELQRSKEGGDLGDEYRQFKRGQTVLAFPINFLKGYGGQKKVREYSYSRTGSSHSVKAKNHSYWKKDVYDQSGGNEIVATSVRGYLLLLINVLQRAYSIPSVRGCGTSAIIPFLTAPYSSSSLGVDSIAKKAFPPRVSSFTTTMA
ncbi:hypothetical protein L3X38_026700 [Prunus dulcis]|uniref:PORR domain-containing protein n=1 Tax=Prunus dulcis TaxID=3755 RepID=A0AAD4VN08_PRUDU|nr:hypothetical protein L3X38_026700 [Prunus dulcis]